MGGRFFTAPFLVSVSLILASLNRVKGSNSKTHQRTYSLSVILIFIALALSIVSPYSPLWSGPDYGIQQQVTDQRGIADERADYYQLTGLLLWKKNIPQNLHREFYAKAQSYLNSDSLTIGGIGFIGFYANENLHIIDRYALADPLLARLPPVTINLRQIRIWPELVKMGNRPGHFRRIAPKGYAETIQTGQNMLQDPNLALYYDKLSLVTRGDLHNFNRLPVIIAFNLGNYDYLLHNYLTSYEINLPNVTTPISFDGIDDITLYHTIDIRFPEITYAKSANITFQSPTTKLNSNDYQEYWLGIIKGGHLLALEELIIPDQTADSFSGRITIPQIAHTQGFDRVIIGPSKTNNEYLSHDLEKIKSIELVN
ncbi:MAG: hypothetical protein Kow0031_08220 [Anaerolineae bacterium]